MGQLRFTDCVADGQTVIEKKILRKKNRVMSCQRRPDNNNNNTEQHTHTHTHTHTGGRGIPSSGRAANSDMPQSDRRASTTEWDRSGAGTLTSYLTHTKS